MLYAVAWPGARRTIRCRASSAAGPPPFSWHGASGDPDDPPHCRILQSCSSEGLRPRFPASFCFPNLRTSGITPLVTIAFALLFKSFIEVNDVLGGPQGIHLPSLEVLGRPSFNDNINVGGMAISFYMNSLPAQPLLLIFAIFVRRLRTLLDRLSMDAVRLDETAASCFGLGIARWKAAAFLLGNFLIGLAGACSAGRGRGLRGAGRPTFADSLLSCRSCSLAASATSGAPSWPRPSS